MAPCSKLTILALLGISSAQAIDPIVKGEPQVLGIATDPRLNRDSCGSTRMQNRTFWTCRDTQNFDDDGNPTWQITSSTASWTKLNEDGSPLIEPFLDGSKGLLMSGDNGLDNRNVYFSLQPGQCNNNTAGQCGDGWRYAIWPDSPPMVTSGWCFGPVTAYTWILNQHINKDFSTDIDDPSVTLYRMDYDPGKATDENAFPLVSVVSGAFWERDAIPYGVYGNIIRNRTAYLFGQPSNNNVALAKVPADSVEDKSKYEYWVGGAWTNNAPSKDDERAKIPNASAGGQGTYYYSNIWKSYVWIGQAAMSVSAEFYITTAPNPWGPWAEPKMFYSGENGSADLSAYTLQAHPHTVPRGKNQIYLSYTKVDHKVGTDFDVYSTPLILVEWE
ncbi:hypothetical protein ACRE_082420 [Hapsidospora chrysogenum ATCC 11550]|uniref:DUF4185 domain-containing protein n=1 Tax=Hapsidospora chrysogenum (strain ATCC 11550 / CBS 779.69 / DSM 880 / IAM 14645 / JCM 23072 / IMI 49137) TaxID=857340 RepID=A0A086SVC4_HAPC1|nr:hypothetical protein ACRE_082420 [Hapsidospora chrysogenum ATCC 11550]